MATKKDLVEAYSFSRRRLVTAFVSGAPGGREVEPARPGRTVVGGLALGVLLLAGAAIMGVFKPHSSFDETQPALVTDSHGALYVNLGNEGDGHALLHPVVNATSAQLILGSTDLVKVPDQTLASMQKGGPLGILYAPATVPDPSQLLQTGWTACTASHHGIRAAISGNADTTAYAGAFLVHDTAGDHVILADDQGRAYAYDLAAGHSGPMRNRLNLPAAVDVPARWTALFPDGGALDAAGLGLPDLGKPGKGGKIGDYFVDGDNVSVVTKAGYAPATPFVAAVLDALGADKIATPADYDLPASIGNPTWPTQVPPPATSTSGQVCAVLHADADGSTSVRAAVDPQDDASALGVKGGIDPVVAPGRGAVVHSAAKDPAPTPTADGTTDTSGSSYLVDDRGYAYRIASPADVANLGYSAVAPVVVSPQWIGLFRPGVELSRDAALCAPSADPKAQACS